MTKDCIIFDDGSNKSLYLLDYCIEQGLNPEVIGVNVADTLEDQFKKVDPTKEQKVFLAFSYEDLKADNERLRQEIQGLETKGWRNLIVLPFEGMDDRTIELRVKALGLKRSDNLKDARHAKDFDFKSKSVTVDGKPYVEGKETHTVTLNLRTGETTHTVEPKKIDPAMGRVDPDDEMKGAVAITPMEEMIPPNDTKVTAGSRKVKVPPTGETGLDQVVINDDEVTISEPTGVYDIDSLGEVNIKEGEKPNTDETKIKEGFMSKLRKKTSRSKTT